MENKDSEIFSFFSQEELRDTKYVNAIENIISKYHIIENNSELLNTTQRNSIHIIEYVSNLLHEKIDIPKDILDLFSNNYPFIENLNDYLEKKLSNLTKNDLTHFFRDIATIVNLFTISVKNEVFISYYHYNFEKLSELFRHLEKEFLGLKDKDLFELKFNSYVILQKALTQLCVVNSTDTRRRKNSKVFMELMTESSNILKYTTKLNENQINILNHIQGTHLYYFLNIYNHDVNPSNLKHSLKIYYNSMERLEDGYNLSKNSGFAGEDKEENEYKEFLIFKNNCSILILELFSKLEKLSISIDSIKNFDEFKRILKIYTKNFNYVLNSEYILENIESLKEKLLNSLIYEYEIDENYIKGVDYKVILNDFILSENNFKNCNLKTIYQILLYAKEIKDFKYLQIAKTISNTKKIQNDYHEFYKLQILNLIISKVKSFEITNDLNEILDKILVYVDKNKVNSHLFPTYSQIYLNLALLYSQKKSTLEKAKFLYSLFLSTSHMNRVENKEIIAEVSKSLKNYELESKTQEDYINEFKYNYKKEFDNEYSIILDKVIKSDFLQLFDISEELNKIIENKLFYGLCEVQIGHSSNIQKELEDTGYKECIIPLENNFSIKLTYLIIKENMIFSILEKNRDDLCDKLNILLSKSDKDHEEFFDSITDLYNMKKLNQILSKMDKEKVGLIQVDLKSLEKYALIQKNTIFKEVANKIKDVCKDEIGIFRLDGLKIGILTHGIRNKDTLINRLKEITIHLESKEIQIDAKVTFLIDKKENILFSSFENINKTFFDTQ